MVLTFVKRPISPLHLEAAPVLPQDIICPGSEDEDSSDEYRDKRRLRVEAQGKQYLEGRPLLIQTASLKGPLHLGWKNPWAKECRGIGFNDIRRYPKASPASDEKPGMQKETLGVLDTAKSRRINGPGYQPSNVSTGDDPKSSALLRTGYEVPPAKRRRQQERSESGGYPLAAERAAVATERNNAQIDNFWLKRNKNIAQPRFQGRRMSPTPTPVTKDRTRTPTVPPSPRKPHSTLAFPQISPGIQKQNEPSNVKENHLFPPQESSPWRTKAPSVPSRLAPYASGVIIDSKSNATLFATAAPKVPNPAPHVVPPSTNVPEFSYRYAKRASTSSSGRSAHFQEALENIPDRAPSTSLSSSDSSAFAEPIGAAPAKTAAGSFASPHSSSINVDKPETIRVDGRAKTKRLSFTASGKVKVAGSCPDLSLSAAGCPIRSEEARRQDPSFGHQREVAATSKPSTVSSDRVLTNGNLPEAQIVPDAPPQLAQGPSGRSTDLLETDRQSPKLANLDEGDSYINLSTQAAVSKAKRSFQDGILVPLRNAPGSAKIEDIRVQARKNIDPDTTPVGNGRQPVPTANRRPAAPDIEDEEPMSTQAMFDAMSPYAITTIKKRPTALKKGAGFTPSPTAAKPPTPAPAMSPISPTAGPFRKQSLSMSTSPSPSPPKPSPPIPLSYPNVASKPPSTLTSFSILPNGTLTETNVYQQDGQLRDEDWDMSLPLDPFVEANGVSNARANGHHGSWDLTDAIEEAGSFLGQWDVEAEARREGGRSGQQSISTQSGVRGILATGKGRN